MYGIRMVSPTPSLAPSNNALPPLSFSLTPKSSDGSQRRTSLHILFSLLSLAFPFCSMELGIMLLTPISVLTFRHELSRDLAVRETKA